GTMARTFRSDTSRPLPRLSTAPRWPLVCSTEIQACSPNLYLARFNSGIRMTDQRLRKYRADYLPTLYLVDEVNLDFDIRDDATRVTARHKVRRNPQVDASENHWWLDGRDMTLLGIQINDQPLPDNQMEKTDAGLFLTGLPDRFELEIVTQIDPDNNLSLEGLYRSDAIYCTQCEATGFSRITYFPDRPDVMSR